MENFIDMAIEDWAGAAIKVVIAMAFGLVLGWERDSKNKPIDFRAYMIVAVTSCLLAIMVQEMSKNGFLHADTITIDVSKFIAGIMTGIGFLGAGAIIKVEKEQVVGTATGASVWAAGGIGVCIGFGVYGLAVIGFIAIAGILMIGGLFRGRINGQNDEG